jgi:hypothetical protein
MILIFFIRKKIKYNKKTPKTQKKKKINITNLLFYLQYRQTI